MNPPGVGEQGLFKRSFFLTWLILSAGIFVILIIPFLISYETLGALLPECESKVRFGKECAFCGMTASFYFISRGEFSQAVQANRFGIYLYLVFLSNEILVAGVLWYKIKRALNYFFQKEKGILASPKGGQGCKF